MPKHIPPIAESNHFIILDQYTPKWEPVATSLTEGLPREIELWHPKNSPPVEGCPKGGVVYY